MPVLGRWLMVAALAALTGCGGGGDSSVPVSAIQAAAGTSPDPAATGDAEAVITTASAVLL